MGSIVIISLILMNLTTLTILCRTLTHFILIPGVLAAHSRPNYDGNGRPSRRMRSMKGPKHFLGTAIFFVGEGVLGPPSVLVIKGFLACRFILLVYFLCVPVNGGFFPLNSSKSKTAYLLVFPC